MAVVTSRMPIPRRALIALAAPEHAAQYLIAALFRGDPGPTGPGRIVAHVLIVAAGELGYPVLLHILMKSDDRLSHAG